MMRVERVIASGSLAVSVVLASLAAVLAADEKAPAAPGKTTSNGIWIEDRVTDMPGLKLGPFLRLADGGLLTAAGSEALVSRDEGQTWKATPIFKQAAKIQVGGHAIIMTRAGTIVLGFSNNKELSGWNWNKETSDAPEAKLPTYAIRSLDGGKTWQDLQKLHDDWTGANRDMIETRDGKIVLSSMIMRHNPGRHTVVTYVSNDEGKTWKRSNVIDLGGIGHHGGVSEGTLEELKDGRLWLLIRTNWKKFWEAFSDDGGLSWRVIRPSNIDASSAPGMLKRLASGRLVLVWNRYYPEGETSFPLSGGDNQWSEVPVSNHRLELSIMFSEDDGKTWTEPVVFARNKKVWLAYPRVFEAAPGQLWITTPQGGLRVKLMEKDFVR